MKAIFRGGPWDGCSIDFPVLPHWIVLGSYDYLAHPIQETQKLIQKTDFNYTLRGNGDTVYYEMSNVVHDDALP